MLFLYTGYSFTTFFPNRITRAKSVFLQHRFTLCVATLPFFRSGMYIFFLSQCYAYAPYKTTLQVRICPEVSLKISTSIKLMTSFVEVSIRYTAYDPSKFQHLACRNINCWHFILVTGQGQLPWQGQDTFISDFLFLTLSVFDKPICNYPTVTLYDG